MLNAASLEMFTCPAAESSKLLPSGKLRSVFVFIVALVVFVALLAAIIQRWRTTVTSAPVTVLDEDEPIDGEVGQADEELAR